MTRRMRTEDLLDLAVPGAPALSPDGSQVVYVLRTLDGDRDRTVQELWRVGATSGDPRRLTTGAADTAPAWSPDGRRLAFLREQDGAAQVWVLAVDGGEPEQVTSLPLGAGAPAWSPDGGRLALTAWVDLDAAPGEDDAARARRAGAPVVTERLDYQPDGAGLLGARRRHLHVVDVATRTCRQVTEGDWHAGEPAWSPDGALLAFPAATADDRDLVARVPVHVVATDDPRAQPRVAGLAEGAASAVTWTADGAALLVVGTAGAPGGHAHLLRVPLDGGEVVDLAPGLDRNVMPGGLAYPGALPQLVDGGATVLFCARDRGCTHLYAVGVDRADGDDGGEPRLVLGGDGTVVSGLSVAGGAAAVVLVTPTSFGEVAVLDVAGSAAGSGTGSTTVRTDHGRALADVELFEREERWFTISDGTRVQAWLVRDPARTGPRPLLLDVHGGPHNAWNGGADEVHAYHQELASRGWAVLLVNPRGSDGYGEAFYTGVSGAWGEADAKDLLEPLDALVAEGVADPRRLAVTGYSYGGYMTCYLTSRDDRFAAAVTGGVVSDLVSMAGTCDEGPSLTEHELGGQPWQDRDRYAAMSPYSRVEHVRTPTLVLQGLADTRCPVGQAQQWHQALRVQGVPTRLVLYPGGSHAVVLAGPPSHRTDYNRRVVDWVEQHAGDAAGPRRPRLDAGHWQRRLDALCERHGVLGAQLGILRLGASAGPDADGGGGADGGPDELVEAVHGVLNARTGVPVTTDSLFQIGSITKVWTTTIAMQLVDEGRLGLDTPVVEVLPELELGDPDVTQELTPRHLMTHTSGIDGDIFTDTGRGDDYLEKYVALLREAAQNHPLGATWSYSNSGFSLLGRVIEKVTGGTWDAALRERLITPLGLAHTATLPEEVLLHLSATGHQKEGDGPLTPAPVWSLPRSAGPAGVISSCAADVLAFARLHLTGGLAADGTRLLSAASAAAMAEHQADVPDEHTLGDSWGLGWIRYGWDGHRLIGHDGTMIGQAAALRLLPEQGLAVALTTNGGNLRDLYQDLYREVFAELAGVAMPQPLAPPAEPVQVDVTPYLGTYERASVRIEVLVGADGPRLRTTATGPLAELTEDPVDEYPMVPVGPDLFVVRAPEARTWTPVTFYSLPTGERYVHFGARATPRVG